MERWAPFKELWSALQEIVVRKNGSFHHLKALLRRHKPDFLNLLKNPVKNTEHRIKVVEATTEGLDLTDESSPQTFSQDFIDEALIISDLFNLNEFSSLELLLEGERQNPHYPQLTRGLVAVLLYWDGRKCLTSSLRTLIQCRRGQTWTLEVSDEVVDLVTTFTDELVENGLTKQILKLLSDVQVEKEMETLSRQRGLGGVKHRKQVRDLISGIRCDLAESLFNFAGQSKLPLKDTMSILEYLEKDTDTTPDGKLSSVTLSLLHAVFYAFTLPQDIPIEQNDQGLELLLKHPLLAEKDFIQNVHKKLIRRDSEWKVPGIKASVQLAWALTLRSVALVPMAVMENIPDTFNSPGFTEALEQDEIMLEYALAGKAFQFLKENVVTCHEFRSEEFYVRRIHGILTDLIVNMPLKVKEMRNRGDEVARILLLHIRQQEEPPVLREDFKQLMELVTALYQEDENDLQLTVDYWCPASDTFQTGGQQPGSFLGTTRLHHRLPQRQVSLFKFLRQSGDLLPPLLYIPYLKMLAALSTGTHSARMAFEMLRANGANMGVASEGSNVSWDHFFASIHRYYANLKQEQSPYDQSGHFVTTLGAVRGQSIPQNAHLHQMTITPQEVEGLRAVLQLLAKIARYDDVACLTVYEHQHWNACSGLLGLLQCPVPAILKGDVLLALNEVARIPEISVGLLHAMENTRILETRTGTGSTERSIAIELEDVEAREERYHMTCAFLKFTCTLTEASNIVSFAASPQSAGFEPFLRFAIELVFLKFMSRSYKRPEEKWEVAGYALKLFLKLLSHYVPHPEDFVPEQRALEAGFVAFVSQDPLSMSVDRSFGGFNPTGVAHPPTLSSNKSPSYHVMTHIMNEGNFFKTIMEVIEKCSYYLDKCNTDKALEKTLVGSGLTALQLIQTTLNLQDPFVSCMRESGNPVLVDTLDKLLLSINPRTGNADYIVTIAKFVTHNATHPQLSLCASEIISSLCRISPVTQKEVFSMLTSLCDAHTRRNILHGFVEALESPQPEIDEESGEEYEPVAVYNSRCRLTILRLMLHCIDLPAPNMTHFLLGFNLTKPINKTSLQDAGVLESPRTCIHSVLSILSFGMETTRNNIASQPIAVTETPALAELCYQLIYKLSANMETVGPVLRYLRSSHDFVYRHLQHLPFKPAGIVKENQLLLQQAWLLKTTAIELFSTSANRQRSHTQRLVQMLFERRKAVSTTSSILGASTIGGDTTTVAGFPSFGASMIGGAMAAGTSVASAMTTMNSAALNKSLQPGQDMAQILRILDELDFTQEFPRRLILDQFVPTNVESAIQSCETKNEHGLVYCDIKALHELLEANVNTLQGTDDADRKARAIQEVQNILKTALERNQTRQSIHSKLALLNAWKHTLEVALNACPSDLMAKEAKQQILLDILQELLTRVLHPDAVQELTSPVAAICLTLMTHLRACFSGMGFGEGQRRSGLVSDMNGSRDLNLSQIVQGEPGTLIPPSIAGSLQVIMKGILEWILQAGVGQRVRANLYASLLYYLQMCQKPKSSSDEKSRSAVSSTGLRALSTDIYSKLSRENVRMFKTYGDVLMELICKDACDGHNVCRILTYSCLDAIVQIDWEQTWLQFMLKKGYINTIAHSFIQEDEALQQALTPNPDALRSLYIYEQKIAFLCSLVKTQAGARALLDSGILNKLSECSFLEMRPLGEEGGGFNSFVPSVMSRYRQLLFPALKVCSSILSTLGGTSHYEASALVLEFMLAHADSIINPVLKNRPIPGDVQSLMELKFVTGILCQVAGQDFSNESLYSSIPQPVLIELQGHLSRIQRQLLGLLSRYCVSTEWIRETERNNREREGSENVQEIVLLVHEICANLISYCVVIMGQKSSDLDIPVLLFAPHLDETMDNETMYRQDHPGSLQQPSLGLLIRLLRFSVTKFSSTMESMSIRKRRMNDIATLTTQELKEITGWEDEKLSIPQRQAVAAIKLRNAVESQEQLLSTLHFIVENTLLLFWQHLDSFILKPTSIDTGAQGILFQAKKSEMQRSTVRRLQDISNLPEESMTMSSGDSAFGKSVRSLGVSRQTINELKRVLPACMTDNFLLKLIDIETQWNETSKCTFVSPLVRRIQRIVKLHTT